MKRGAFRGRVLVAERSLLLTLFLSALFLLGALLGNRAAGLESVYRGGEVQALVSAFLTLARSGRLEDAPFSATLCSYFKYPILIFLLRISSVGMVLIPVVVFFQGVLLSFAVSAFLFSAGVQALPAAVLLFALRSAVVLPCCFALAERCRGEASAARRGARSGQESRQLGLWGLGALCALLLLAGAAFEHLVLAGMLHAVL